MLCAVQTFEMNGYALFAIASIYYINETVAEDRRVEGQSWFTMGHDAGQRPGRPFRREPAGPGRRPRPAGHGHPDGRRGHAPLLVLPAPAQASERRQCLMSGFPILCVTDRTLCAPRFLAQVEAIAAACPAGLILREKNLPEARLSSPGFGRAAYLHPI